MAPRKPATLGSHNRSWIWGRHVVLETLRAGIWTPRELLVSARCGEEIRREVFHFSQRCGISPRETDDATLARRCRADDHQGLAAEMPAFPYASLDELLSRTPQVAKWLVLDRLHDSFNFGAIVRTASALGIDAVVIGAAEQSEVNSQVARSSSGAVNYLPIARVPQLSEAVTLLCNSGVRIVAASEKASQTVDRINWHGPAAIVIGNEGCGIHADILQQCDQQVRIPMSGRVGSLNAAVAAGILCYEMMRNR